MPATSEKQKNFMKMVLAHKDGKLDMSEFNDAMKERIAAAAKSMTKKELHDFVDAPIKEATMKFNIGSADEHELRQRIGVTHLNDKESVDKVINAKKAEFKTKYGVEPRVKRNLGGWYTLYAGKKDAVKETKDITFAQYLEYVAEMSSCEDEELGFKKLQAKIEAQGKSPEAAAAIAASIGRKKYGKAKFQKMAVAGKK